MKRTTSTLAALAMGAFLFSSSNDAKALGPVDVEIAARAGLGSNPTDGTINPLGFGLGARGGVSIIGIYGGLSIIDYFGGSDSGVSAHALLYGLEGGYGIKLLDLITLRLTLGLGNAAFSTSGNVAGVDISQSKSYLYLEPGVTGLISLGSLFVGADLNALIFPSVDTIDRTTLAQTTKAETAVTAHAQVGFKF